MCGRFTLRAPASVIAEQFSLFEMPPFTPRFNIAPTQPVAAVRHPQGSSEAEQELVQLRWGLIPAWAKDPAIGSRMINARAETVDQKPAYRTALARRRCLVVADGFYEWQRDQGAPRGARSAPAHRAKQPYFIHLREDRPFAFAGLWEAWEGPDHSAIESCTLLTTQANELVGPIHDRMPVIVSPKDYSCWLDADVKTLGPLKRLLAPFPAEQMEAYPVSTHVNSPRHDDPACVQRVA